MSPSCDADRSGPSPTFTLSVVALVVAGFIALVTLVLLLVALLRGRAAMMHIVDDFASRYRPLIRTAPRELWLVYGLKLCESYGYFSFSLIMVLYLSEEFGLSDAAAGWTYGLFGMLATVYGLLVGMLIDNLGVRRSLILGSVLLLGSRLAAMLTTSIGVMYAVLFVSMPLGTSLGIPVLTTAIRRYTTDETRAVAFGLFYASMNVAALISGPAADLLRGAFGCGVVALGMRLSPYRLLLLTSVASTALQLVGSVFVREIEVLGASGGTARFEPRTGTPWRIALEIGRTSRFWRFLLLAVLLVAVRLIFRHLDATLPKFLVRAHGPAAPYGLVYAINPCLIIILVPVVSAYTRHAPPLQMIRWGAAVSAASPFWLAASSSLPSAVAFVVTLSLGEACWSPRFYEYAVVAAPKGREGTYMALSSAPIFLAKLLAGGMSGALLQSYCPGPPCEGGRTLWLIIGLVTASSPVLLFACSRCIAGPDSTSRRAAAEEGDEVGARAEAEMGLRTADSAASPSPSPSAPSDTDTVSQTSR